MTRLILLVLMCLSLPTAGHSTDGAEELYRSQAIVTGIGEKNRQFGFRDCLDRVILRVSGDQRLLDRPELAALRDQASNLVASFTYRDRLEGTPIHDEQGSYDRPHDLTCIFDRAKLDAVLADLGGKPWLAARPTVVPLLLVERGEKRFLLTADGSDGPFMDEAFAAAASLLAMKIALPGKAAIAEAGLDGFDPPQADPAMLDQLAGKIVPGSVPLSGRLVWSDPDLGWVANWRIAFRGTTHDWQVRGVGFDEAFRVAMRGAAQVLSGNGQP